MRPADTFPPTPAPPPLAPRRRARGRSWFGSLPPKPAHLVSGNHTGYWLYYLKALGFDSQVTCLTRCPRLDTEHVADVGLLRSAMLVG
jgi:hypothetical protein